MFTAPFSRLPLGYIVINLNPIALQLGPFAIHWYGLAYVLAISLALLGILRYADNLGIPREYIWNLFLYAAVAGLIGGRLYFVIQQPDLVANYLEKPLNIIAVWNGGMAYFGAIFLGAPTAAYMAWRAGLTPWIALDLGGLFGAVGQMFGRLGNLVNGDIVGYPIGTPNIPAAVCAHAPCLAYVPDPHLLPWSTVYLFPNTFGTIVGSAYQPAAFYEILWNLAALALLWPLRLILPQRVRQGAFFCVYVALYSLSQIVIFFWRSNVFVPFLGIDGLKQAQWTGIFTLIGIALVYWFVVRRFAPTWDYSPANPVPLPAKHGDGASTPATVLRTAPVADTPPAAGKPAARPTPAKK